MSRERQLLLGGCLLSFGAAFVNTGLVIQTGTSVSHLTGDISKLAIDLTGWTPAMLTEALRVGIAALGFFTGALATGFSVHHPTLDFSRPYGKALIIVSFLFGFASLLIRSNPSLAIASASIACGVQNSLASHYRGIVLRTTHLTGMFTDLGVMIGMRLRGHRIPPWKVLVPGVIILSFFLGGISSAILHLCSLNVLLIAAGAYLITGIAAELRRNFLFKESE